jgi:hypothetical protein
MSTAHRRDMQTLRRAFEAGDRTALAMAINRCAIFGKPLPPWAAEAWRDGWTKAAMRVADWNDLLGEVRVKTPGQIKRERVKLDQLAKLVELLPSVQAPIERDSEGFFRELAEKMGGGIKWRAVKELYYLQVKFDGEKIRVIPPSRLRRRPSKRHRR